jgi:hypothetical protein
MNQLSLSCLWDGPMQLILFTVWNHQPYILYGIDPSNLYWIEYGYIKCTLLTLLTNHIYVAYSMNPSTLPWLQHGAIKLTLLTP